MVQGEQPYSVDALIRKKAWKGLCFIAAKKLSLFLHSSKKWFAYNKKEKNSPETSTCTSIQWWKNK
jgi:hypothetical protein